MARVQLHALLEGRKRRPAGRARSKAKVVLVNLATGEKTEIEGAATFRFNGEAATHIAYRKVTEPTAVPMGPPGSARLPRADSPVPPAPTSCSVNSPPGSISCSATSPITSSTRRANGSSPPSTRPGKSATAFTCAT